MNRREFLVALGAAGCGAKALPDRTPRHVFRDGGENDRADAPAVSIADDFQPKAQLGASPIVARGPIVARATETELSFIDARSLKAVRSLQVRYGSLCGSGAGSILALTRANGPCEVERFDGSMSGASMLLPGGCTSEDGALMVAAGNSLYVSASGDTLAVYKIAHDRLEEDGRIRLDDRTRDTMQIVGLVDGRLLVPAGKDVRVYRAAAQLETLRGQSTIVHLVAGAPDRIWYSTRSNHDGGIDRVVLAKLEQGMPAVATLATRVVHLAAAADGSGAAVLSVAPNEWSIIVLDANGQERRRIYLPRDYAQFGLTLCFVALTADTVILDARGHGLFGWTVATGMPV